MKIKYATAFNSTFQHSIRKLVAFPQFPIKTAYSISRISDKIQSEINAARTTIMKELQKHVVLNEDGTIKLLDKTDIGSYEFKDEAAKDAFEKQENEFMGGEFDIDWRMLTIAELDAAGFKASATEINALMPIIQMGELEAVK